LPGGPEDSIAEIVKSPASGRRTLPDLYTPFSLRIPPSWPRVLEFHKLSPVQYIPAAARVIL
jgi:hypothetical protein